MDIWQHFKDVIWNLSACKSVCLCCSCCDWWNLKKLLVFFQVWWITTKAKQNAIYKLRHLYESWKSWCMKMQLQNSINTLCSAWHRSLVSRKYCFHHHYRINFRWTKSFSHFLLKVSFSVVPSNGVQSSCSDACKGEVISEGIFNLVTLWEQIYQNF